MGDERGSQFAVIRRLRPNWLAEHHNVSGIACAATAVLIAYIADGTRTIRAGSGGIMLLNHAPLIVAEQFETLETLYPRRIDLGLGRAPETDMLTSRALRRALETDASTFADACWNFDIIPKMWKGGAGCPRNSRRRPAGSTVYSGFELIRGSGVGHVRLALCVRFTMIRNRSLATILAVKRMFQSGRSSSIRYAGPSQLAPSTNGNIPSRRWLSFLMKVPSSLLRASKQRYSRCRADANSCVRPFRGVAAAFSNNAQDSRRFASGSRICHFPGRMPVGRSHLISASQA